MRVLISGGTGMIGSRLAGSLLADGHQVWVLTRRLATARLPAGARAVAWDGRRPDTWVELIGQVDAVVNLVGERLAKWPWTSKQKNRFVESRVDGGRVLTEAIVRSTAGRPKVLVQASGVNYYGPHGEELLTEAASPGGDFLARLCVAWEASTKPVEELGVRRAIIRSGIVLSADDGILPIMRLPIRLFAGGPLGSGRQGLPWIHIQDEVAAIRFLLENEAASGPFNLTAPQPVSSGDFLRQLAKAIHRPYWLPAPAFVLRLALGGMSDLLLAGEFLLPRHLLDLGFHFKFEKAEDAFQDLFA